MPHFGQRSGRSLVTSGCIGQMKRDGLLGRAEVHLGDERERLVGRRVDIRPDPLTLCDEVGVRA